MFRRSCHPKCVMRSRICPKKNFQVPTESMLKFCRLVVIRCLAQHFSRYLMQCDVLSAWKRSKMILLFKKGDREHLSNYRSITLLPALYKVFTKCLLPRIRKTLEEAQPVLQAGFRWKFSTLYYILTNSRLIEATREYHQPLVLRFIHYHKALDSMELQKVWESLNGQGIEDVTPTFWENATRVIVLRPFHCDLEVTVERDIRQGDSISPNLFLSCLKSTIRCCNCGDYGIEVEGRQLNHQGFANDIVLIKKSMGQASRMLHVLHMGGAEAGLTTRSTFENEIYDGFAGDDPVLFEGASLKEF